MRMSFFTLLTPWVDLKVDSLNMAALTRVVIQVSLRYWPVPSCVGKGLCGPGMVRACVDPNRLRPRQRPIDQAGD